MRRLNPELFRRLMHWGRWRSKTIAGLNYPSMTAEAKLRESPGKSETSARVPNYWPDPIAAETQLAISELDNRSQLVLWCEYAQRMQLTRAALAMGMSLTDYRLWIRDSHKKVADRLDMRAFIYDR